MKLSYRWGVYMETVIKLKSSDNFKRGFPFYIAKCFYENYEDIKLHAHEFIEVVYVCNGKGIHIINGMKYDVAKGDLFIINSETPHSFYPLDRSNSGHLAVFNCLFLPEFLQGLEMELTLLKEIINIFLYKSIYSEELDYAPDLKVSESLRRDVAEIYDKMYLEYTMEQDGYVDILKLYLSQLLIKIYRAYKAANPNQTEGCEYKHRLILEALDYLRTNYINKLNLDEVSTHVFLSKSYFCSLFKKETGMSVIEYLQKLRIEKACRLLQNDTCKITDVAEKVGYTDYRFFNKTFKKIMGMTAQNYRNQGRK